MSRISNTVRLGLFATLISLATLASAQSANDDFDIEASEAPDPAQVAAEPEEVLRDPSAPDPAKPDPSLLPIFKAFGEKPGLVLLMDQLMLNVMADPRTRPFFENADREKSKRNLVDQFCSILGGPCSYSGRDMKTAHADLKIGRNDFNALVENLQRAMDTRHIPFRAQNKLLAKLSPMHREVETR